MNIINKLNVIKKWNPPTRNINYKRIDFAPCNKLIIANKLPSTNFKWLVKKSKFVGRKKTHPEHKYSR